MPVVTKTLGISSKGDTDIIDITADVAKAVGGAKIRSGIVTVFVSGSTAGVTTTEFEPNLNSDLKKAFERLVPPDIEYRHHETWGDDNGKSHVRASLLKPGLTVPFIDGKLLLGTWQQIVVVDFDVPPRRREITLQIVGE